MSVGTGVVRSGGNNFQDRPCASIPKSGFGQSENPRVAAGTVLESLSKDMEQDVNGLPLRSLREKTIGSPSLAQFPVLFLGVGQRRQSL